MKILTPDIADYVSSRDWPKGLIWDLRDTGSDIRLVFYRENWVTLSPTDIQKSVDIVKEVMFNLRALGIPAYFNRMETRRV